MLFQANRIHLSNTLNSLRATCQVSQIHVRIHVNKVKLLPRLILVDILLCGSQLKWLYLTKSGNPIQQIVRLMMCEVEMENSLSLA